MDLGRLEGYTVKVALDIAGRPVAWSVTALWENGTYTVKPGLTGPFDTLEEAMEAIVSALDTQGVLW